MASVHRPLWCLLQAPAPLVSYLEGRGFDLLRLLKQEFELFWRCFLDMRGERQNVYVGVHVLQREPELRLLCCVGTQELDSGTPETQAVLEDLLDALKQQITWQAHLEQITVPDGLLDLLQVSEEPEALSD
ncbi:E4 ORF2 [Titi monkey adenovirus ECC-2011]|uniref:E4 ORF2 n=1 Tax=titi monkey adenovirus 1 TaxID=3123084 RepID=G0ZAK3_9ADEN|nr:E4 ORF2 [Titi monkey adenovirus ECC-2011]AEK98474.1 E4 ORF2 [Titi monkey adenovirus ECC-2011]